jgi:cell division protein FtsB
LIKDLENRLQEAKDLQTSLAASIAASQAIINDNNTKIANIRNTIDEINAKIRNLRDTLDALNKSANTLEVDVSRARTDLSVAQAKDKTYGDQIKDFQNQINVQTPKLVDDDLKKLRVLIDNLNNTIPQIQNQINREYYYCYGAGKVDTVTTGSVIVYVVKGEAFGHYIQNAYGQTVSAPTVVSGIDYRLQVVDPFSRIWTAKYGYPLANGARTAGTGSGSFSCQGGNSGSSGWGTISSVSNDGFWVNDASGKSVKLSVGTCSRVESTS